MEEDSLIEISVKNSKIFLCFCNLSLPLAFLLLLTYNTRIVNSGQPGLKRVKLALKHLKLSLVSYIQTHVWTCVFFI